jgi:hypothetical protein
MRMRFPPQSEVLMRVAAVLEQMMQEFVAPLKGQDCHVRLADTLHPVAIAAPVKRRYDSELIGRADFDNFQLLS